jgi:hypothetical protein
MIQDSNPQVISGDSILEEGPAATWTFLDPPGMAIIPNIVQGVGWGLLIRDLGHTQPSKKNPGDLDS